MSAENHRLMRLIDATYLAFPFFGSRQMPHWLRAQDERVNRKGGEDWLTMTHLFTDEQIILTPKKSRLPISSGHLLLPACPLSLKSARPFRSCSR